MYVGRVTLSYTKDVTRQNISSGIGETPDECLEACMALYSNAAWKEYILHDIEFLCGEVTIHDEIVVNKFVRQPKSKIIEITAPTSTVVEI